MTTIATTEYVVAADVAPIVVDVVADVGNARTVVLVRKDAADAPIVVALPSVRTLHGAFSYELFAARGLPAASWGRLGRDEHVIELGGVERFVGQLAVEHTGAASSGRGSDQRYVDGTTLDFVLAGVAAALPGAARINVRLTTMLPISLWPMADRVAEALRGRYPIRYNGRDLVVTVATVAVKREAEAAFGGLDGDTSGPVVRRRRRPHRQRCAVQQWPVPLGPHARVGRAGRDRQPRPRADRLRPAQPYARRARRAGAQHDRWPPVYHHLRRAGH
jgi:hypothetical protein